MPLRPSSSSSSTLLWPPPSTINRQVSGSPSSRARQRTVSDTSLSALQGATPCHEPAAEWSCYGLTIPLDGLQDLRRELYNEGDDKAKRLEPPHTLRVLTFGGDQLIAEIVSHCRGALKGALKLYISYESLEDMVVPWTINLCIREPGSKPATRNAVVWEHWADFNLGYDKEDSAMSVFECQLPALDTLMQNRAIKEADALLLTIQMQTPLLNQHSINFPRLRNLHLTRDDFLNGITGLFDDLNTADLCIVCFEKQGGRDTVPAMYRKRCVYAHSSLLKARSAYFKALLSGEWADSETQLTRDSRKMTTVKALADFEVSLEHTSHSLMLKKPKPLQTTWWLLKYVYTDQIDFVASDDSRQPYDPISASALDSLSWTWQSLELDNPVATSPRRPNSLVPEVNLSPRENDPTRLALSTRNDERKAASNITGRISPSLHRAGRHSQSHPQPIGNPNSEVSSSAAKTSEMQCETQCHPFECTKPGIDLSFPYPDVPDLN